jgi:hypothetical protein
MTLNTSLKRFIITCKFSCCYRLFLQTTIANIFFKIRYKSSMRLNISKIRTQDFGEYHCVSKNEMGTARAVFHLEGL